MSKPGKSLRRLCKKMKVRLTVNRGKKRVYKSEKVLKKQCKRKAGKKKKKVKRRRKFGVHVVAIYKGLPRGLERRIAEYLGTDPRRIEERRRILMDHLLTYFFIQNNPPPRIVRQEAQQDLDFRALEDDPGFGN